MKLLTLGDSFTYGAELEDKNKAWPSVLGDLTESTVINLGDPGCANWRMIRWGIEHASSADLVIVAWSSFIREEYADEDGDFVLWANHNPQWYNDKPPYRKELIKYITVHHNLDYMYRRYLNYVILFQSYLKNINKKYLMLDVFGNQHAPQRRYKSNKDLIDQIDTRYYLGWPNESMAEWTRGVQKGPGGHFLDDGHKKVADKINEHIRHLGWVS